MLLLAFDTATPQISVALNNGERVLAEVTAVDARRHGELLAPSVTRVLSDAGQPVSAVTAIVVGVGPGPYTGLRVGVVTARVLGAALRVPVHGVCTLDVIAHDAAVVRRSVPPGTEFLIATDARRKEVYWARYCPRGERLSGPSVSRPADVPGAGSDWTAGQGAWVYPDGFAHPAEPRFPSASVMAALAAQQLAGQQLAGQQLAGDGPPGAVALLDPEPLYLRRPDARQPGPPKAVTPR